MKTIALAAVAALAVTSAAAAEDPETILAVFAHADDDLGPGAALTRYAKTAAVHVVYVSDGRYGVSAHAGTEPGAALVDLRKEEARCAATARGWREPVFLGHTDQIANGGTIREQFARFAEASAQIAAEIERLKPDAVVTFGPGGYTSHPDHRLVGDLTAQAVAALPPGTLRLYQFGLTKEKAKALNAATGAPFVGFDAGWLDVAIAFGPEEQAKEEAALRCYASQFAPETMDALLAVEDADEDDVRYFHEVVAGAKRKTGF